jgi:hypothetical protein
MQPSASATQVSSEVAEAQNAPAWLLQPAGAAGQAHWAAGSAPAHIRRPAVPHEVSTPQAGQPDTSTQVRTPPPGPQRRSPRVQAGTHIGVVGRS